MGLVAAEKIVDKSWGKGVIGELLVNGELEKLASDYQVFCDVKIKYGNIDNVVICDAGIITIEVKNMPGRYYAKNNQLYHNGYFSNNIVKQTLREKLELKKLLKQFDINVEVRSVLLILSDKIDESAKEVCKKQKVILLEKYQLLDYIQKYNCKYKDRVWDKRKAGLILGNKSSECRRSIH